MASDPADTEGLMTRPPRSGYSARLVGGGSQWPAGQIPAEPVPWVEWPGFRGQVTGQWVAFLVVEFRGVKSPGICGGAFLVRVPET